MNKDELNKHLMAKLKEDEDAYWDYMNHIRAQYLAYYKGLKRPKPIPTAAERLSRASAYVSARLSGEVWHE